MKKNIERNIAEHFIDEKNAISCRYGLAAAKVYFMIMLNCRVLKEHWYVNPQEIADELGMSKKKIKKIIKVLEEAGLIDRDTSVEREENDETFLAYLYQGNLVMMLEAKESGVISECDNVNELGY